MEMKESERVNSKLQDEVMLRRYLLGELTEDEEARQEERLFTEQDYFDRLLLVEDDLIDEYVSGTLSGQDKERMERRFLASPARQEKLRLATDLKRYSFENPPLAVSHRYSDRLRTPEDAAIRLLARYRKRAAVVALALALLIAAVGVGAFLEIASLHGRIDGLSRDQIRAQQRDEELHQELAQQTARSEQLSRDLENEQTRRIQLEQSLRDLKQVSAVTHRLPETEALAVTLVSGRTRDRGPASVIEIPASATNVRLGLSLEQNAYSSYRAVLQTDEGKTIWSRSGLRPRRSNSDERVEIALPASLLVPGDYTVLLSPTAGRERVGTYYFTTSSKR
jgi:hypothetical protein